MSDNAGQLTPAFGGLVDDAAIFPPGNMDLADAVPAHARHRRSWYADLVGPFLCVDSRLPDLHDLLGDYRDDTPLGVVVVVRGGAGAVEPAITWALREPRLHLAGVEVALRDEADLAHNAARMTTMLAGLLPEDASAVVEMPRLYDEPPSPGWTDALDQVAAAGYRAKFRTGGLEADAFPSATELARVIDATLDREMEFKCTAGLHRACRHVEEDTGFVHHGFLNVLLATRALLDGAAQADVVTTLEQDDCGAVSQAVAALGTEGVAATRRWFTSFGTCSVREPLEDLEQLGLVHNDTHNDTQGAN